MKKEQTEQYIPSDILSAYFTSEILSTCNTKEDDSLKTTLQKLFQKMNEGHVCIKPEKDLKIHPLIGDADTNNQPKPFILANNFLYTGRNYYYETLIVEKIKELVNIQSEWPGNEETYTFIKDNLRSNDDQIDRFAPNEKPDWQLIAALNAVRNSISLITGGPGTGKTTTVAKIMALLTHVKRDIKIEIAAPTGKAGVRMKESLLNSLEKHKGLQHLQEYINSISPKTIHRLLGSQYKSPFFKHNASNCLDADVIIIDESSMIGVALFAKILDAINPKKTKIIFLGDSNQLSSVESGSIFGDICKAVGNNENKFSKDVLNQCNELLAEDRKLSESYELASRNTLLDGHLVRLQKTYRYDSNSDMGLFTANIISGKSKEALENIEKLDENLVIDLEYDKKYIEEFAHLYSKYIEEKDIEKALKIFNDTRVLCAVKKSVRGVAEYNKAITDMLKKKYKGKENVFTPTDIDFYHNQPIIVTKNTDELGLSNGDVGIIRKDDKDGKLWAFFPEDGRSPQTLEKRNLTEEKKVKKINPGLLTDWETVFAMTIHKSQGSEFTNILIVLPEKTDNRILSRELVYTAITRGKSGGRVVIQTRKDVLEKAIQTEIERISGLSARLSKEMEKA